MRKKALLSAFAFLLHIYIGSIISLVISAQVATVASILVCSGSGRNLEDKFSHDMSCFTDVS